MSKYTLTVEGYKALDPAIELTSKVIELNDGSDNNAWTMNATYMEFPPCDNEGWAPFYRGLCVADALKLNYIVLVACIEEQ